MLHLSLPSLEVYDESKEEFITIGGQEVDLEHSLYTIAKWEAKHHKSFAESNLDTKELIGYIKCMCMTPSVPDNAWLTMTVGQRDKILEYMADPHTGTTIKTYDDAPKSRKKRIITVELIYYWMFQLQIPMECEHWHFNRLMTLIEVCSLESQPKKKMGKNAALRQQRHLNDLRRAQMNSKG